MAGLEAGTSYRWRVAASQSGCLIVGPVWRFTTEGGETEFRRGDADTNGAINITDAVRILNVLFLGIGAIPLPGIEACGLDPTDDALSPCAYGTDC